MTGAYEADRQTEGKVMKIAFASTNGKTINQKFGETTDFKIWEVGRDQAACLRNRSVITNHLVKDERTASRASTVADSLIVCSMDHGYQRQGLGQDCGAQCLSYEDRC